ncbi:MlaE family ABC transporter permease [Gordonia sp. CPCC 205333]|uniref:MlaE family ABC transporter permease n=1 Tax=Gordonia sp. CPCC 205333 TaxID=3140790 RepID=UPI003AF4008B
MTSAPPTNSSRVEDYALNHPVVSINTFGRQLVLLTRTLRALVRSVIRRDFSASEFIRQCAFMASAVAIPTVLVAIPIGVIVSIQVGTIANQVGANAFTGAANGLGIVRQGAPLVTAMLIAGAVGSAVCADLGTRTVREEIDALKVLGLSPVDRLVVPRFVAALVVSGLLCGFVCFVGFLTGYVFNVYVQNGTAGSYLASFAAFTSVSDLVLALIKAVTYGAIVAIVACDKGLNTRGGPAGVANSVNSAVVSSVILLFGVNVLFTQLAQVLIPAQPL